MLNNPPRKQGWVCNLFSFCRDAGSSLLSCAKTFFAEQNKRSQPSKRCVEPKLMFRMWHRCPAERKHTFAEPTKVFRQKGMLSSCSQQSNLFLRRFNNKSNLKTNFKLTSSKTTFFFCSLVVCFLENDCLGMRVPKFVSWPETTYSNKPSFCIGRQTLPLQRFLVSFLPVETWLQNDCFHRPKPWFQCIVFLPANSLFFSEADVVSLNSSFLPAWTPLFLKLETLVLKLWFPDCSPTCPANICFPFRKQTFFSRDNLCFGSHGTSVSPSKMCVFPAETHRFHQR